jgi:hypothetical protein
VAGICQMGGRASETAGWDLTHLALFKDNLVFAIL